MSTQIELRDELQSEVLETPPPAEPDAAHVTIIQPAHGWQGVNFREIWRFRELMPFYRELAEEFFPNALRW